MNTAFMKKLILFILILFFQSNSNANECNMSSYEGLANCSIETIERICPFGYLYNNTKVNDQLGKTNLKLYLFDSPNCNGKYKKIFNKSPSVYIFTENNSTEVSWVRVSLGKFDGDRFNSLIDAFKKYERNINFPSKDGLKLLRAGKISDFIFFYDNFTKGMHFYRDATGIPAEDDTYFDFSLLFFNSSSEEKINRNKDFFIDLNEKINSQSGSGNQL